MSPRLTKETVISDSLHEKKYVLHNRSVEMEGSSGEEHVQLAERLGVEEMHEDSIGRLLPIIDAAGKIYVKNGKIGFGIMTTTCFIRGDTDEAASKIRAGAQKIFGKDKVI